MLDLLRGIALLIGFHQLGSALHWLGVPLAMLFQMAQRRRSSGIRRRALCWLHNDNQEQYGATRSGVLRFGERHRSGISS
jgi:hypothetical protein